ncbi:unnamed protein product [Symbiodinium natans]|uniref:Fungal lipase-like domain-containing protein n=1 Tax=Symbiodinium natans TaxID=878477 RepID=A0A812T1T8_9DINO|nr:unnamed protein product [Symbiodinium natans]
MLSTSMSPRDQGYAAESLDDLDLESRSGQAGESSHAQMEEDSKDKSFQRAGTKDSRFMHPDDSLHLHWYETTVRLRGMFYIFFSLAVVMALSLGCTAEAFFFIMASPEDSGLSFGIVVGILLTPLSLLLTAIYVDECIDMGLDAADKPSFGLFRAAVTAATRCFGKVQTDHVERALVLFVETVPIIFAIISLVMSPSKVYWYKEVGRGYCLGGLICALCICITYIACHAHVGHIPARDELMAELYHNMGPLGRFRRAEGSGAHELIDKPNHWGRACCFGLLGLCIEIGVILVFLFFHRLYAICIGELLATLLWAFALRSYAPRLLGKAFWCTLIFFILLAASLLMGTMQSAEPNPSELDPMVLGPASMNFNTSLESRLPLHFEASPLSPHPASPICRTSWGEEGGLKNWGLSILDLSIMAFASSFGGEADVREGLGKMLNGTFPDWELLEVENWNTTGRWIVVAIPSRNVRIISVRGTTNLRDAYANLQIYSAIVVLQLMGILTPVLSLMPQTVIQRVAGGGITKSFRQRFRVEARLADAARKHKEEAKKAGQVLVMTGHSLGGALVGAVSTQVGVPGVGFSPPGLLFQKFQWDLDLVQLTRAFTVVQPTNDVVPQVDSQRGLIEWLPCGESALTCHRLTHTACALWAQCGDSRPRDWRPTCSRWFGPEDLNLPVGEGEGRKA